MIRLSLTLAPIGLALLLILPTVFEPSVMARSASASADGPLVEARGQTMGTGYMVKLFDPPSNLASDWRLQIDAELRRVNDQMSTYLESSELSRFNRSESTDWFDVSPETAMVVEKSLEIHRLSGGAFDVTVAPLVNAWSFGPGKRTNTPPDEATIAEIMQDIGSAGISVRRDPPALRKDNPRLMVDLSAIAKGHGVDRVVDLLARLGAQHVFVEIGGEVRVMGDKHGKPWTVGIQMPDVAGEVVAIAYPITDKSIATSGDYRNFFEHQGTRYSHTIDPRTGRPVNHTLASVSIVADDCMTADAWATALTVLGVEAGKALAERLGIDALMIHRVSENQYATVGLGALAPFATAQSDAVGASTADRAAGDDDSGGLAQWIPILVFCFLAFAAVLTAMAVGVMAGRRSISGSCGGLANKREPDGSISCALCSNPDNACKELKARMQAQDPRPQDANHG